MRPPDRNRFLLRVLIFNLLQIGATVYALRRGGAPERMVGLALLLGAVGTRLLQSDLVQRFVAVEVGVAAVDVALLAALLAVALLADRFWPLWIAALQALGAGSHLVRLVDGDILRVVYAFLSAIASYPMLAILVFATSRHDRRERVNGPERSWSGFTVAETVARRPRSIPSIRVPPRRTTDRSIGEA